MADHHLDPYMDESSGDPREWILEDPGTFYQVFTEPDNSANSSTPDSQARPTRRMRRTIKFRHLKQNKKAGFLKRVREDEGEESGDSQPWLKSDGSDEEEYEGEAYYMSGALGVRDAWDGGEKGGGDTLLQACGDGLESLDLDGHMSGGDPQPKKRKHKPEKKDKGKARVRFDETVPDRSGDEQAPESSKGKKPRGLSHSYGLRSLDSAKSSRRQSFDREDSIIFKKNMDEFS